MNTALRMAGVAVAMGLLMACTAGAQQNQFGLGVEMSYFMAGLSLPDGLTHHPTHPDDRVFMAGDAGDTEVDSLGLTMLALHLSLSRDRTEDRTRKWEYDLAIKFPLSGSEREEKQNENDVRPPEQGSYIYTEVEGSSPAIEIGFGASYHSKSGGDWEFFAKPMVYLGYWSLAAEAGWNRFGSDQPALSPDASGMSVSPQLHLGAETDWIQCQLTLAYRFLNMDYGDAGSGVSHGAEVGLALVKGL